MVAISKITSKGQVTIPKDVRERMGVREGDEIEFVEDEGGFRLQKRLVESPFEKWRGFLNEFAERRSDEIVEEMRGR